MADYTKQGLFVEDGPPPLGPAQLNAFDDGIADAATHHRYGTFAARPAASALNKNHIYWAYDTGQQFRSNGATWDELAIGNAGIQDGAVSLAKLGAGVTALLPATGQKAAMPGIGGMQNHIPVGYNNTGQPGAANQYLLQSAVRSFWVDIAAAGGGSVDVFETGLWLVNSVYGFQDDQQTTRCSIVMMSLSTGGEGLKGVVVLATGGYARNVTTSHTAVNHDTATGALRITTTNGNQRTFFRSLRVDTSGGNAAKGA